MTTTKLKAPEQRRPRAILECPHCGGIVFSVSIAGMADAFQAQRKTVRLSLEETRGFIHAVVAGLAHRAWSGNDDD